MPRLASIRQPNGQELHWTQLPALRLIGPPLAPSASAPSIASWPLRPIRSGSSRRHPQELLGLGELGVELARPVDPVLVAPALEHLRGRAEAGAGVDHRGAADRPPDRDRDRRPALGDGQAGVAVEAVIASIGSSG